MDLGCYQQVNEHDGPDRDIEELRPFVEGPSSRLQIKRKPVSTSSFELTSFNSSQKPFRDASYEESSENFNHYPGETKNWQKRLGQSGQQVSSRNRPAWCTTVLIGLILAVIVFLVNISILAWTYTRFSVKNNAAVLFSGSCAKTSMITAAAELAINILSTLLLAASNNCAQLLISPTRTEIDKAHEQGVWLHVGIASARNLKWIGKWRIVMWAVLFASSIPLHLLYNSVIYSSTYANDWLAAAVTEEFLDGGAWNQTIANHTFTSAGNSQYNDNTPQSYMEILSEMQNSTSSLINLTNDECQSAFGTANLQSPYLNVLLVTNYTQSDSFIDGLLHYPEWETNYMAWFNMTSGAPWVIDRGAGCAEQWDYSHGLNWSLPVCNCTENECIVDRSFVQNCLAQPAVIVCNAFKAICLSCTLMATSFHPLVTVGDAVASFIGRPDPTTVACGPLSLSTVQKISSNKVEPYSEKIKNWKDPYVWKWLPGKRRAWGHAIGSGFSSVIILILAGWFAIMIALSRSWTKSIVSSWSHDVTVGTYTDTDITPSINPTSLAGNVVLVNTPQLAVSLIYVLYNALFTRMLVAYEFSQFGRKRKSLRVSRPIGTQRSTYWLQLPYRYILPLMSCMALIHFFISRGIYLININVYNISGQEVPYRDHFSHATSGLALLLAFLVGTVMLLALLVCICRSLGEGIPILGSNSVAISSACHPAVGDEDAATKELMYGVVNTPPIDDQGVDRGEIKHVCFSSFEVKPLENGMRYY